MVLLSMLAEFRQARRLAQLVRHIVWRSYAPIREAAEVRVPQMSPAEARGYIRAKATPVLRAEVEDVLKNESGLGEWARPILFQHASDHVVQSVLSDLVRREPRKTTARRAA